MNPNITSEYTRNFSLGELPEENQARSHVLPTQGGKNFVQFFIREMKDEARSISLGRYVPRELEMIRIYIPGDNKQVAERRARPEDKIKYRAQYDAFKKLENQEIPEGHLALEYWTVLSRAQIYDLKSLNIFTVQQLAGVPDEALGRIGIGARQLRKHAQVFLETAAKGVVPAQLVAENETLRNQVTLLTEQIAGISRKLEAYVIKSGDKVEDVSEPIAAARAAVTAAIGPSVVIPNGWERLGLPKLREICSSFSTMKVLNREDAVELIEEYIGRSNAQKAA